ncbi:MAG TPA: hypothetical protein VJZ68_05455 [Nitrososphaera sp.]|nr:hypothetical protein [Nitrososphaera sp.]
MQAKTAIILSDAHGTKCKIVLIEEIMLLNKELRTKNEEIAMLRKRILL